jgi:hypothetical protein
VHRPPPAAVRRPVPQPESFWSVQVHPSIMRHLPQWVLAGTALVSVSIVGAVYLFNPPVPMPSGGVELEELVPNGQGAGYAVSAEPLDDVVAQFERRIADAAPKADPVAVQGEPAAAPMAQPQASAPVQAAPQAVMPKPRPRLPMQPSSAPLVTAKAGQAKPAGEPAVRPAQKPAVVAAAGNTLAIQKSVPEEARPAAVPAAVPQPAAGSAPRQEVAAGDVQVAAALEPVQRPALPDPNTLLARFLEAYEKGDIQACMSLLDEGMRAKQDLRREYDTLFRSTDLRHIKVQNMNWSREGDSIRGEGQYRLTMMRKGETLLKSQSGQFRVELIRRGNTALINDLQYIASGRS